MSPVPAPAEPAPPRVSPALRPPTAGERVVSAGLWAVGLAWMILLLPALTLLMRWVPSHRIDPLTRLYTRGQVALTLCRWRAHVDPAVEPGRAYLFVQNHVNVFDHCTMYASTPHFKQGMELASHFRIPVYGPFMRARGTIGVDPEDPAALRQLHRQMKATFTAGRSLLAFPEGTRTRSGRVQPFHEGILRIAVRLGIPVVPVAVTGMFEVLPTGGPKILRPFVPVHVHVLAPVETEALGRDDVPALVEDVRGRIAAVVDRWYDQVGPPPEESRP